MKRIIAALFVGIALFIGPTHEKVRAQGIPDISDYMLFQSFCQPGQACTIVGTMAVGVGVVYVLGGDAGNFINSMQIVQLTGYCPSTTPTGEIVGTCTFTATAPPLPGVRWAGYKVIGGGVDVVATYCFDPPSSGPISAYSPQNVRFR